MKENKNRIIKALSAFLASVLMFCGASLQSGRMTEKVFAESVQAKSEIVSYITADEDNNSRKDNNSSAALPASPDKERVLPTASDDDLPVTGARAGLTSIAAVLFAAALIINRKDDDK